MATDGNPLTDHLDLWTSALLTKSTAGRGGNGKLEAYGIKKLRELILELAVRGKLVPQDPNDEPASALLERISEKKCLLGKRFEIAKEKPVFGATPELISMDLPEGWRATRFGSLIGLVSGQHLKPEEYVEEDSNELIPYLTGPAEFGDIYPEPTRYTNERRALAESGDVLITCKGSGVGKTNVANKRIAISRQLMSIRPFVIKTEFTKLLTDSLEETFRKKVVGIAIPGISREDVLDAVVHLPPLAEQHRIVAKVDELMALCDRLEQQQAGSLEAHQTLVESLLGTLTQIPVRPERYKPRARGKALPRNRGLGWTGRKVVPYRGAFPAKTET